VKLLLENMGISNYFLNRGTPIAQEIRARMDTWDCISESRQPTEWENVFTSYSKDKELICKSSKIKQNNPINN
jgi:hypothetical protein